MKVLQCSMTVGKDYEFYYPRHNLEFVSESNRERRRVRVIEIRLVNENPIDPLTKQLNPHIRRGQHLVTGIDLDKGVERSFYYESMSDIENIIFEPNPMNQCEVHIESKGKPIKIWMTGLSECDAEKFSSGINEFEDMVNLRAKIAMASDRYRRVAV